MQSLRRKPQHASLPSGELASLTAAVGWAQGNLSFGRLGSGRPSKLSGYIAERKVSLIKEDHHHWSRPNITGSRWSTKECIKHGIQRTLQKDIGETFMQEAFFPQPLYNPIVDPAAGTRQNSPAAASKGHGSTGKFTVNVSKGKEKVDWKGTPYESFINRNQVKTFTSESGWEALLWRNCLANLHSYRRKTKSREDLYARRNSSWTNHSNGMVMLRRAFKSLASYAPALQQQQHPKIGRNRGQLLPMRWQSPPHTVSIKKFGQLLMPKGLEKLWWVDPAQEGRWSG